MKPERTIFYMLWQLKQCRSLKLRRGKDHHKAKLTEEQVREIRRLHAEDKVKNNTYELSYQFDVEQGHISNIVNRKSWKHL